MLLVDYPSLNVLVTVIVGLCSALSTLAGALAYVLRKKGGGAGLTLLEWKVSELSRRVSKHQGEFREELDVLSKRVSRLHDRILVLEIKAKEE
jgi:hypothetical protein